MMLPQATIRFAVVLAALAGWTVRSRAQESPADPSAAMSAEIKSDAPAGIWPTSKMVDSLVRRVAADVREEFDLRPAQALAVEQRMVRRWQTFLSDNRDDLEPLVNEYLETRIALEPPDPDRVADWAARAMPVFNRLKQNIDAGERDVRDVLDEPQRERFDRMRPQIDLGLGLVEGQLKRWSVGKFQQSEWWDPPAGYDRQQAQSRQASASTNGTADVDSTRAEAPVDQLPPRITGELHTWEKYVADFCDRYQLDTSQRVAADSILREMLSRARDHTHTHRERIAALENKIATGTGQEDESFNRELAELYGPIDRMFHELADRVDKLPTQGQRRAVERAVERAAEGESAGETP